MRPLILGLWLQTCNLSLVDMPHNSNLTQEITMNKLLAAAMDASSAFDADIKEVNAKKLTLTDVALNEVLSPKRKAQIFKTVMRNLWKAYEIVPEAMMVRAGYADKPEVREAELLSAAEELQELHADAYLADTMAPPASPLGFFAIRLGESWYEIHTLEGARDPEILARRGQVSASNNFA